MPEPSATNSLLTCAGSSVMAATVRRLARNRPELADRSGVAIWPVPAMFPRLLSRAVDLLQQSICVLYLDGDEERAGRLAEVRSTLVQLAATGGDLGEDHCLEFLRDHPDARRRACEVGGALPFEGFLYGLLKIKDPIEFAGAMLRNEEGSPEEIEALLENKFVNFGRYFEIHQAEEPNHARLSVRIAEILAKDVVWREKAIRGIRLHDELYSNA